MFVLSSSINCIERKCSIHRLMISSWHVMLFVFRMCSLGIKKNRIDETCESLLSDLFKKQKLFWKTQAKWHTSWACPWFLHCRPWKGLQRQGKEKLNMVPWRSIGNYQRRPIYQLTSWWFQLQNLLVTLDHFRKVGVKIQNLCSHNLDLTNVV